LAVYVVFFKTLDSQAAGTGFSGFSM